MKVAVTLFILCSLLSAYAQQFSADFITSNPSMGNGILKGKFTYSWTHKSYQSAYTNIQYSLLWTFNDWYGQNKNLPDPFVDQWRFKQGPGCPGGCETGRVTNSMPVLFWNTTQYSDDNFSESINGVSCSRFSRIESSPDSGVTKIWFSAKNTNGNVCKVQFADGTFYEFTNVNRNPSLTAASFTPPSGCSCSNPLDIVLVLDRSGSISVNEWSQFYNFLQSFGKAFKWAPDKANLAIVNFNTKAFGATIGSAPPVLGLTGNSNAITSTLASLACCNRNNKGSQSCCDGYTSLAAGVRAGYEELAKSKREATKVLVLLTDGKANTLSTDSTAGSCYRDCCNIRNILPSKLGYYSCPDDVYGPGIYPGAQYLHCIGDKNYDTIVDDWQTDDKTKPSDWPCSTTNCGGNTCCNNPNDVRSSHSNYNDYINCNNTGCYSNSKYLPKDGNSDAPMKACHRDLIEAREYGYRLLGDNVITYAVGVGSVSRGELQILTNNRYKRPSTSTVGASTLGSGAWTPVYREADNTNPERVTTVDKWEQMAGILIELTAKICDEPAVQLSCGSGCCGTCFCAVCTPPDGCLPSNDKCVDIVLNGNCCQNRTKVCEPKNCQNVVCDPAKGCVYTPRACTPSSDACYNYVCDATSNNCNRVPKWSEADNACYSSYCDESNGGKVLVINKPKDCSNLNDACTTYSCQNSTGQCIPTTKPLPTSNNKCEFYTCDKVTGPVLNTRTCTDSPCYTTACDPATGECKKTPIVCNDPANKCDLTECDPNTNKCRSKTYKNCPNPTNPCIIGNATCDTQTGNCINPTEIKSCEQKNCHYWRCDSKDGECKADSEEPCNYCIESCANLDNKCYNFKCNTTTATATQTSNCDNVIDLSKDCDVIYNSTADSCILGSTCDNTTGCQPIVVPPCEQPEDLCFVAIRNSSYPGCCQIVPKQNCDFGDLCYKYGCDAKTGNCTQEPVCNTESTPCFNRECIEGQCIEEPVNCTAPSCYDFVECNEELGGCISVTRDCDDKNACTYDSCDIATDSCTHADIVCPEATDSCTIVSCDIEKGCQSTVRDCDDGIECTRDYCDANEGCKHETQDDLCDDNNLCTVEFCDLNKGCVFENITCETNQTCVVSICKPTFGCVELEEICVLNETGHAVFQENPDLNSTLSEDAKIQRKIAIQNAQDKINEARKRKGRDCSYAVCQNSTCVKKALTCYDNLTVVAVASSLAAGAIAGIVIAIIVAIAGIGGGSLYVAQNAGGDSIAQVNNSPLYQSSGLSGTNPLEGTDV